MSLKIDISLRRGELDLVARATLPDKAAIFGPSGAGKTTLLDTVAGLLAPHSGRIVDADEVLFDSDRGIDLAPELRRYGYAFQDDLLFPHLTVRDNLLFGRRLRKAKPPHLSYEELVEELELRALLSRKPHALSGGERRRVSLGRALLSSPRRLLLDEPLSGLQHSLRDDIVRLIRGIADRHDVALIVVTHEPRLIDLLEAPVFRLENGVLQDSSA